MLRGRAVSADSALRLAAAAYDLLMGEMLATCRAIPFGVSFCIS